MLTALTEYFLLRRADAAVEGTSPDAHRRARARLLLGRQKAASADTLWRNDHRAEALALLRAALDEAVAATVAIIAWSLVATWVAQSDSWDGMGYHEPMIGFALQNHGFRPAPVPRVVFYEAINGLPRHCEMTALWLVAFVDRRLIELPNTLASPMFLLGVYLLAKRFGAAPARAVERGRDRAGPHVRGARRRPRPRRARSPGVTSTTRVNGVINAPSTPEAVSTTVCPAALKSFRTSRRL